MDKKFLEIEEESEDMFSLFHILEDIKKQVEKQNFIL
jgi:hypothetical protein